jgi:hypothetical protein
MFSAVSRSSTASPAVRVVNISIAGWTHFALVYREGRPRLYVNGNFVREGLVSRSIVHPGVGNPPPASDTVHHFDPLDALLRSSGLPPLPSNGLAYYFEGNMTRPEVIGHALSDGEIREMAARMRPPPEGPPDAGTPIDIRGPWEVRFQDGRGAPASVTMPELVSLHKSADSGVKCFRGRRHMRGESTCPPIGSAAASACCWTWGVWR